MIGMQTYTDRAFDLANPDPAAVEFEHLGVSLSRLNRFLGATRPVTPYNVAHHSALAEQVCPAGTPPLVRLAVILHDAHEAYTGDITSPVKRALRAEHPRSGDAIRALSNKVQAAVHRAFGLYLWELEPGEAETVALTIHNADMLILAAEKRDLLAHCPRPWEDYELPDPTGVPKIDPLPANTSCHVWQNRVRQLIRESGVKPLPSLGWL